MWRACRGSLVALLALRASGRRRTDPRAGGPRDAGPGLRDRRHLRDRPGRAGGDDPTTAGRGPIRRGECASGGGCRGARDRVTLELELAQRLALSDSRSRCGRSRHVHGSAWRQPVLGGLGPGAQPERVDLLEQGDLSHPAEHSGAHARLGARDDRTAASDAAHGDAPTPIGRRCPPSDRNRSRPVSR